MRRLFVLATFVSLATAYNAQACNTQLKLTCQGTFLMAGQPVLTASASDNLADEHWDEPSEANCAATVYLTNLHNTSVRVYANLEGSQVSFNSMASQVYKNDQNETEAYYSNELNAADIAGKTVSLGLIHLANPVSYGPQMQMVTDVDVTCTVK